MAAALISFDTVNGLIEGGGYAMLFGLLFACGLGLPLPEDIPLIIAGALVARGNMHLFPAAIAAWCGIIGGDIMLYQLGKRFGLEITRVRFVGKHLTQARIERVERMFDQYGVFVVAVGRLFAGVRGAMVVAAGVTRYNFVKFLIADGIAAIFSGGFFMFVGHWLGTRLNEGTIGEMKHYFIGGALIIAALGLAWILWRKRQAEERMEKAAATAERVAEKAKVKPPTDLTNSPGPSTVGKNQGKEPHGTSG
ncbi:MAG TPA: DedA family protein [Tepidisphaeraceae bacterium]|nr:DedA family protein [Tepidisphaeraceae bacterium]